MTSLWHSCAGAVLILSLLHSARSSDVCASVPGCRCGDDKDVPMGLSARCKDISAVQLQELPFANITVLTLQSAIANQSDLNILRNFSSLRYLSIRYVHLSVLDWKWLPGSCTKVKISLRRKRDGSPSDVTPPQFTCDLPPSLNVTLLSLFNLNFHNIPRCLPSTLKSLQMVGTSLIYFESTNRTQSSRNETAIESVKWPKSLKQIYLTYTNFGSIGEHVFKDAPHTLKGIRIASCRKPLIKLPSSWPPNSAVKSLTIINCDINETQPSDFDFLQSLTTLSLQNNKLVAVPEGLPKSLNIIWLGYNSITTSSSTAWQGLVNLTTIDLDNNLLRSVPLNLPENLVILILRNNLIEYSDPQAFAFTSKLEEVDFSYNRLVSMPEGLPITMKSLSLVNNNIVVVRSSASYEFCANCTQGLSLSVNPWVCDQNMIEMLLWADQNPVKLRLKENCGQQIPDDLGAVEIKDVQSYFIYMRDTPELTACTYTITELRCVNASISNMPTRKPPRTLTYVLMNDNPGLRSVPDNYFKNQMKLTRLDLGYNSIVEFPKGLPTSLETLSLESNQISTIPEKGIPDLVHLQQLYLSHNQITTVYDYQLTSLTSLYWLGLDGNPLNCDCSLYSFVDWFMSNKNLRLDGHAKYFFPTCQTPERYRGYRINQLRGPFQYDYACVASLCNLHPEERSLDCSRQTQLSRNNNSKKISNESFDANKMPHIPVNSYWLRVDLSNLELTEAEVNVSYLPKLTSLNLTGNRLTSIPFDGLPQTTEDLIISNNDISKFPDNITRFLPKLKVLDLRNNHIERIQRSGLVAFPLVESILLQGNPIKCDCELRSLVSYIQTNTGNKEVLIHHQFKSLACQNPPELRGKLLLELTENEYCQHIIWTEITGGVVGGVIFLLLVALVAIGILYRRRKLKRRKDIIKGFHELLEKESHFNDEDVMLADNVKSNYIYDAFVSFCSSGADEDFVYKMLQEMEDARGRKICMHERDFTPGKGIADNIVECISLSRRVIIVVSRKYAMSAWCQYEVQVALAQLHKHRRGRLLIPILLEDVTKDENYAGSVATILSLITGLHVPSPQEGVNGWKNFWDKLEAALPSNKRSSGIAETTLTYQVD